jgi:electron transfer flavoprotein alpha subunit
MKFIEVVVDTWETLSNPAFQSTVKRSENGSKLIIEINTKQYSATIEAWEQAYSMDISAVELISNTGVLLSAGECTSSDEMIERITLLCEMLGAA